METLLMPLTFVFLAALLLWVVIGLRGKWWLKLGLILLSAVLGAEMWLSIESYFGKPRATSLEQLAGEQAYLFWARVEEPDKSDLGAIYFWMRLEKPIKPGVFAEDDNGPALYRLTYSRSLHETTQDFLATILGQLGAPIKISFAQAEQKPSGSGKGQGNTHGAPGQGQMGSSGNGIVVPYVLPPSTPPIKQ
jgi:hypothetical protein